ncbi:MAG: membrane protein insertion efficiency factor YidD [Ruminococcus sp.]|nr:membrane protein insertion efficiency factor YidD [Ruminococcus sp.]
MLRFVRYIFMLPIRFYQRFISPLFPARCKYYPTCSAYCLEAYKRHGAVKGTVLSTWRLLRCNPWSLGGVDRVPEEYHLFGRIRERNEEENEEN